MRRAFAIVLLIFGASVTPPAIAACTLSGVTTMAFGTYIGVVDQTTSSMTVTCTFFSSYTISLSTGNGSGATLTDRAMTGPRTPTLVYQLFRDSARSLNWGNNAPGQTCYNFGGCTYPITVYGQIGPGQLIVPGSFIDTVVASIAGSPPANIGVNASFFASCLIPTTTNLNFGVYTGAQLDSTATISINCTNTTPYNIGIQTGLHGSGANFDWELLGPSANKLSYKIYADAGRTTFWGGSRPSDTVNGTGNGSAQPYTIYGRIAAAQYVIPGAYSDTITFTLYY